MSCYLGYPIKAVIRKGIVLFKPDFGKGRTRACRLSIMNGRNTVGLIIVRSLGWMTAKGNLGHPI